MFGIACTEDHAFRHDVSKFLGFHVGENDDLVSEHLFQGDIGLQPRDNCTDSAIRLTQVNLLNVELLRVRMRLALDNLAHTNITLSESLELLGEPVCLVFLLTGSLGGICVLTLTFFATLLLLLWLLLSLLLIWGGLGGFRLTFLGRRGLLRLFCTCTCTCTFTGRRR